MCWYGCYVFLYNLLVSAHCQQPLVSCIPVNTIPTPRPVKRHTAEWCYITTASTLHPLWPHCNASMAIFHCELLLTPLVKILNKGFWSKFTSCFQLSENTDSRCRGLITPPPSPLTLTHFKQLSTQAYLCSFEEPPDHIFTFDNLFPSGCSTQTFHRQSEEIH